MLFQTFMCGGVPSDFFTSVRGGIAYFHVSPQVTGPLTARATIAFDADTREDAEKACEE